MTAEVGQEMEKERKGEKFTLIDPAVLPEEPISPNRPAIIFLSLVLALGAGVGSAAVAESMNAAVRGAKGVVAILHTAPLAVIPYLPDDHGGHPWSEKEEANNDHYRGGRDYYFGTAGAFPVFTTGCVVVPGIEEGGYDYWGVTEVALLPAWTLLLQKCLSDVTIALPRKRDGMHHGTKVLCKPYRGGDASECFRRQLFQNLNPPPDPA